MTNFHKTEVFSFASLAKEYFEGAWALDEAQRDHGKILFRPTLFLAGQGLELMLKACTVCNAQRINRSGRGGHDIVGMWLSDACEPIRRSVFENSVRLAVDYRQSGEYPDVLSDKEVVATIDEYVRAPGVLHGGGGTLCGTQQDQRQKAPRTPFLVKTLYATADDFIRRPSDFSLAGVHEKA